MQALKQNHPSPGYRLAADIGGTFTDIVLEGAGRRWSHKTLTTYDAPERAILDGIDVLLSQAGISPAEVSIFVHGMTLATNAVLERRGARTALLTTEGFRDTLEIGYETRYDAADLMLVKQKPLVAREYRLTVRERMSAQGEVLLPLDERDLEGASPASCVASRSRAWRSGSCIPTPMPGMRNGPGTSFATSCRASRSAFPARCAPKSANTSACRPCAPTPMCSRSSRPISTACAPASTGAG